MCDLHAQGGLDYDAFERMMLAAEPGPLAQLASEDSSPEIERGPLIQSSSGMASQQAVNMADGIWYIAYGQKELGLRTFCFWGPHCMTELFSLHIMSAVWPHNSKTQLPC